MVLVRAFYALRHFYAKKFMDISLTKITSDEAIRIIRLHDLSVKIIINDVVEDGFATWYDTKKNEIKIHPDDLYEEIVLHEIGHAIKFRELGSANNIYHNSDTYTYKSFIDTEVEAWLFAEKYSSSNWTDSHRAHVRMCLDGYKSRPTLEYGTY